MIIFLLVKPDNKKLSIKVNPTDTIADLKKKSQIADERFHDNLMFTYDQINLSDDKKTIGDYSIEENSTIYFYYCEYRPIHLHIQTFSNKDYYLYFDPTNIFHDVKKYLENKFGVPKDQLLVLCNEVLDDNLKLEKISLEHFSFPIFICPPQTDDQNLKSIIIKHIKGSYYFIQFNSSEKVSELKKLIQQKLKTTDQLRLYYKEILLEDSKSIQNYSLPNYSLLLVSPELGGETIDICIKYLSGKELSQKVESKDTIENIKLYINYIDPQPIIMQDLSFNNIELKDDKKTLESLSIGNGSKINIAFR